MLSRKERTNPSSLLNKYMSLEGGAKVESWQKAEQMTVINAWVRTGSGGRFEKPIMLPKEEYRELQVKSGCLWNMTAVCQ